MCEPLSVVDYLYIVYISIGESFYKNINLETTAQFFEVPEFRLSGLFRGENRQFCVIFRRSQAIYHLLWLLSPPKEALILSM